MISKVYRPSLLQLDEIHAYIAYIGLESETSVIRLNRLKNYWSSSELLGNSFFKGKMSRDTLLQTRVCLQLYPSCDPEVAAKDPM